MNRNPWLSTSRAGISILILGLSLMIACTVQGPAISAVDEAVIYSAVIRQLYGPDDTFGGTLQPPVVYLVGITDDGVGDPDSERAEPESLAESLRSEIVAALADLPAEFIWVDHRRDVALDTDTDQVIGNGIILTLGNIHPQEDGVVRVSGSIYIANLAAGGQTYILEQVDGAWTVMGTTGVQWIS